MDKLTKRERKIVAAWELHDDGDISTERLFAMVCDDCKCDSSDVTDAMVKAGLFKPVKK